jgi:protein phosphatase
LVDASTGSNSLGPDHIENQDSYLADGRKLVFALADGVGAYKGAKLASEIAIEHVRISKNPLSNLDELKSLFLEIHLLIGTRASLRGFENMGTTLSVALVLPDSQSHGRIITANVGDTPILLCRGPDARALFDDDSGRRRGGGHALAQYLGADCEISMHQAEAEYSAGDSLLVCSDGITDNLSPQGNFGEIAKIVGGACRAIDLVNLSIQKSIRADDMTAILVHLG